MPIRKRQFKTGAKWCVDVMLPNGRRYRRVGGAKKQTEQVQKKLEAEIVTGRWHIRETENSPYAHLSKDHFKNQVLQLPFAND